ncbi:hypothetical protein [Streptomyces sp. RB17]|uniref:hypothetical protein n=1 Tax=Streptomyces sp. RB17 TaxID=2585197 RepID=UPI001294BC3F|nr:hypothetical protein [Streptomyces sp. RB17]
MTSAPSAGRAAAHGVPNGGRTPKSTQALGAALADIDTVFNGFACPSETGCERCFAPEETAYLRTPCTRLPPDLLNRFVRKVPDHFEDHATVMRRLLPQCAHAMADGTLDDVGWAPHGMGRADWRSWPAEQASAVEAFVLAWWQDVLASPAPPYSAERVFETCASILRTTTPLLDRWGPGPSADAHLVGCARSWQYDLVNDDWPFTWWSRRTGPPVSPNSGPGSPGTPRSGCGPRARRIWRSVPG